MRSEKNLLALAIAATWGMHAATAAAQNTSTRSLEELTVYGTQGGLESETGSRLGLTLLETPATVDIIDGNAIRARIDTSVLDAVTRSASFTNEANPGNGHSSIAARGFRGQGTVTKLYDGTNYYTAAGTITFPFDTWGVERIEVLKGPSSVLYGEGGIGGAINIVPRRPQFERDGAVRLLMGENDTTFIGVDYTDGITDSLAYRVDLSKSQSDNWVDAGDSDAEMFSFALRWDATENLTFTTRYDWGDQAPMKYFGVPVANGDFVPEFVGMNFNVADSDVRYKDDSLRFRADWRMSDTLSLQADVFRLSTDRYWSNAEYYSYDSSTGLVDRWDPLVIGHDMDHTGVRASFQLSPSDRIEASLGFEANDISFVRPTNFGPANPNPIDWDNDFDTVDPQNFQPGTLSSLTDAPTLLDNLSDVSQIALFGEARFHLSDRLALLGALRYDDFQTDYVRLGQAPIDQNADAVTGRLGLVFDLSESTALYGQYGTGATHPSNSVVTASASNRESDLIESEQIELGVKHQVMGTGLTWSVALFDIVKNNLIEDDPDSGNPNDLIVTPEQTSQGIELGFSYAATADFQLYGNLSSLDAETDTGETPTYVPEETWNLGFVWRPAPSFRLIADARYVGERFHPARPIPSFTVIDASVHWALSDDVALALKADNLFDELYASSSYYSDTWLVGRPRTWNIVVDYRF